LRLLLIGAAGFAIGAVKEAPATQLAPAPLSPLNGSEFVDSNIALAWSWAEELLENQRYALRSWTDDNPYQEIWTIDDRVSVQLLGFDLNASALPAGEDIVLRRYWRAESPTDSILHVYNHLINADGEIAAQADYVPLYDDRRQHRSAA